MRKQPWLQPESVAGVRVVQMSLFYSVHLFPIWHFWGLVCCWPGGLVIIEGLYMPSMVLTMKSIHKWQIDKPSVSHFLRHGWCHHLQPLLKPVNRHQSCGLEVLTLQVSSLVSPAPSFALLRRSKGCLSHSRHSICLYFLSSTAKMSSVFSFGGNISHFVSVGTGLSVPVCSDEIAAEIKAVELSWVPPVLKVVPLLAQPNRYDRLSLGALQSKRRQ